MPARARSATDRGFTLIELLVVIVIVAVLSAIALPVYTQQRRHAHDATARAELRQLVPSLIDAIADLDQWPQNLYIDRTDGHYVLTGWDGGTVRVRTDLGAATDGIFLFGSSADNPDKGLVTYPVEESSIWDTSNWCVAMSHPDGTGAYYRYTPHDGFQTVTASTACTGLVAGGPPIDEDDD